MDEQNRMRDVTAGMEYFVPRAHARARARTHGCARVYASASHDVSRRSSRQILFRKIGLPLSSTTERQQLCVRRILPTYQYHVTCVGAGASEKLSRLSPLPPPRRISPSPPTFNLSLFSSARQTAIPHEFFFFFFFSVYLNHAERRRPLW